MKTFKRIVGVIITILFLPSLVIGPNLFTHKYSILELCKIGLYIDSLALLLVGFLLLILYLLD